MTRPTPAAPRTGGDPPQPGGTPHRPVRPTAAPPERRPVGRLGRAVLAVLPQWLVARLIVGGALALAHLIVSRTGPQRPGVAARVHQGLLGWDAGFYEGIARHGYAALGPQSLRFFPLLPLGARALAVIPGLDAGRALLVLANVSALLASALLYVLVRRERGDEALARRTVWLLCLAPPAFVLVMGYAEATLLLLGVTCFLALRPARGAPQWLLAAAAGYAAALTRPLGVLLALAVAVEAARHWPGAGRRARIASGVALVAPVAGLVTFLAWAGATFGDFWLPLRVQTQSAHHGGLADPLRTLAHDASQARHDHFGTALHVPWVLLVLALLVVCWRRWPASYAVYATAIVAVALSGSNLDSFERYALSAFPLVMCGGLLTGGSRMERGVLTLAAAGLAGYALLSFLNLSVP